VCAGGSCTTGSLRHRAARRYALFAFGRAAADYAFLTDHEPWRRDSAELAALVPGPSVLDLGVGPGGAAIAAARADPTRRHLGVDRSAEMLRRAAAGAVAAGVPLTLVRADALALPIHDGSLGGAIGHSVLYLLPDPAAALRELHRAVRPGGRVAFLEPRAGRPSLRAALACGPRFAASMVLWRGMSRLHCRFDEAGLAALLEEAGFRAARSWQVLAGFGVMACAERP
jgi:ubiquinone/menaquinone biosynthesis C-methylase UbiE